MPEKSNQPANIAALFPANPGPAKGSPKVPGSGRRKGSPNKMPKDIRPLAQKYAERSLRKLWKMSTPKHSGEIRTKGGEPHTVHGLLCKSGVVGLPTYKKNRTRTVNRFLDDCHQLVDDQVIGHFGLVGKGPDEKCKAIIKAHPDIMREYKKLVDAQKAAIKKAKLDKQLGWTKRKDVA